MRDDRRRLGAEGEARAAAHLEARGYRIIGRNLRAGGVELDLIARRGRLLVFVEVKTRRGRGYGAPAEAVDARKRERLVRGARAWLHANRTTRSRFTRVRFDVIALECRGGVFELAHLEGAFDAEG